MRTPKCLLAEVDGPSDGLLLKALIEILNLANNIIFKYWVDLIVLPSEGLVPEYERVDAVVTHPARLMVQIMHAPLTTTWNVKLVTQLALEDKFVKWLADLVIGWTHDYFLPIQLPYVHLLLNLLLVILGKTAFLCAQSRVFLV